MAKDIFGGLVKSLGAFMPKDENRSVAVGINPLFKA